MILSEFEQVFNDSQFFRGSVKQNEPLSKHTTMHTGGRASLFIQPFDIESLCFAVTVAKQNQIDFFLAGGGSNVIFSDKGLNLVINTRLLDKQNQVKQIFQNRIEVSAGTTWGVVLEFCKKNDLGGLENFSGLSGSVGGAIFMNASCFSLSTSDRLQSVMYFDSADLKVKEYTMPQKGEKRFSQDWGYKKSPFQEGTADKKNGFSKKIILSAVFAVDFGFDSDRAEQVKEERRQKGHFFAASAGSVFKNLPEKGIIAGKLIEECGLKGMKLGGAQISPLHANFIINPENKAKSKDVRDLVDFIKKTVMEQKGIKLDCEIIFI